MLTVRKVLFPFNVNANHWISFAVYLDDSRIEVRDSYWHQNPRLERYHVWAQPLCDCLNAFERGRGRPLDASVSWLRAVRMPAQDDAVSCGVHMCMGGRSAVLGTSSLEELTDSAAQGPVRIVMALEMALGRLCGTV